MKLKRRGTVEVVREGGLVVLRVKHWLVTITVRLQPAEAVELGGAIAVRGKPRPTSAQRLGADVEIVEPYTERGGKDVDTLPCIKPSAVRVNGTDVGLVAKDGVEVGEGGGGELTLTLVLQPRSVVFKAE